MRPRPAVDAVILVLTLGTLVALSIHRIVAYDIWWQLATGEWILDHGWPRLDPFSYGEPGRPWIEMRWLFCVGAFLLFKTLGLNFLIVAKTLVLLAVAAVLWRLRRDAPLWTAAAGVALFCLMAHPRFLVRPEILTFACLALVLERLDHEGGMLSRRSIALLAGLQLLWVNSHSTFLVGPAVLAIYTVAEGARWFIELRSWPGVWLRVRGSALAAVVTTGVCLVNPYGLDGLLFPIQLLVQIQGDHPLNTLIQEFVSPLQLGLRSGALRVLLAGGSLAALSFWFGRRRSEAPWLVLWLTFLGLALLAQRNVALFGVASAVMLVRNLRYASRRDRPRLALACRLSVLALAAAGIAGATTDAYAIHFGRAERFGFGTVQYRFPFQALAFVDRHELPRPVIGKLGSGGAFIFDGGPRSTFVDGRLEVYSPEFIRSYRRALGSRQAWDEATERLGVRTAVLKHTETAVTLAILNRHPDWVPVHLDAGYVVYVKIDDANRAEIERLRFDWATVEPSPPVALSALGSDWLEGWPLRLADPVPDRDLGRLFLSLGELERSRGFFRLAHRAAPGVTQTRLVLGMLERALGDDDEAARLMAPLPERLTRRSSMLALQAQLYEQAGRPTDALASFEAALAAGGGDYGSVIRLALATGSPQRAAAALQGAHDRGNRDPALLSSLGVLYLELGNPQQAERALRASIASLPEQPKVLNQLGILAARDGRLEEGRTLFRRALALDPNDTSARSNLARLEASASGR